MSAIRLGAVDYLNARPLVHGLERDERFLLRFDAPSACAALLHHGAIDLGMIPTIEYCRGPEYCVVPGIAIISRGEVASVALFTRRPIHEIRTIAADTSSRTSNALLRILCAERFGIDPAFRPMPPDPGAMLDACDAALIIGDPALYLDPAARDVRKIDLGQEWIGLTGLPFVWAFWAGRPGLLSAGHVERLQQARDAGLADSDRIAESYCGRDRAGLGRRYLRDNIQYHLEPADLAGLLRYYELAARHGLIDAVRDPQFYPAAPMAAGSR